MGVLGLKSFIENNSDFLKPLWFRDSKVIIDGSNLCHALYHDNWLDQIHGGDYDAFMDVITQFFKNLDQCNIKPYVVFDGGNDSSDKKLETLIKRSQDRIKKANVVSRGQAGTVLILIGKVFQQTLQKLGVPSIQCLAEADWELAALANEWNCPVLSNDSDFYIFNIRGGVLPINHFQWKNITNSTQSYIPARWFCCSNLRSVYKNMNESLLPLVATILGNDYSKLESGLFPNWAKFSTKFGGAGNIDGLLIWLSRFSNPEEAINALLSQKDKIKSARIRTELYQGMQEYRLDSSSIEQFFISGEPQSRPPGPLQSLPDWMLKPFAEGELSSPIINVLILKRIRLKHQVENYDLDSSNKVSLLPRRVMYGVLLCARRQDGSESSMSAAETVEEHDRQKLKLTRTQVPAELPRCAVSHLYLDTLWEAPHGLRLQVLWEALRVSSIPDSYCIPENLQLAVYTTTFWLNHAQPEPRAEIFWALLIGLVYGELRRERRADDGAVIRRLENLRAPKVWRGARIVDLELAHAYSQWRCCLKDGYNLNQLLNNPVPEPELSRLYCGPLVHAVAHELMRGVEPESLLTKTPHAVELYQKLQAASEHELDRDLATRIRTRTGVRPPTSQEDDLSELIKHLMDEDKEENDGDQTFEDRVRVRSRHRSRGQTHDPRSKKQERARWQ
ncbi:protein asteroid homolog 1-like [Trichomycterus rosablanca]|uniref:protein asteroid homolog 1-like n=1 Tax=Trichomycterus rosablanca TaxID=2290929 RepID=UPI002F352E47